MVVGQRQPQRLLKPTQVLGKAVSTTGQPAVLLPLREVVPLDETGIDRLADGRVGQSRRHGRRITKDDRRGDRRDAPTRSVLDHLGIQQVGPRPPAGFGMRPTRPATRWTVPFPINFQQGRRVSGPLIAGEKGDGVIRPPTPLAPPTDRPGLGHGCRSQNPPPGARPAPMPTTPTHLHTCRGTL